MLRPLAAALLLALPAAATAQDVKPVDVRRLAFEYKCVFEDFKEKAESEFLQRLRRQREAFEKAKHKQLPEMEDLLAKALWARAKFYEGEKKLDQASSLAGEMLGTLKNTTPASAGILDEADTLVVNFSLDNAKKQEASNSGVAWKAYQDVTKSRKEGPRAQAVSGLIRISKLRNNFEATVAKGDEEESLGMLTTVLGELKGAMPEAVYAAKHKELDEIKDLYTKTEGGLGFMSLQVTDFKLGAYKGGSAPLDLKTATFSFTPVVDGRKWPLTADTGVVPRDKHALVKGTYDVRIFLAPAKDPVAVYLGVTTGEKSAATPIAVPSKIPEGMVYVGPWKDGGGFFIDRTEVTIGEVEKLKGSHPKLAEVHKDSTEGVPATPQWPAWFFDEETARAYEAVTGKSIPTVRQWKEAAFGPNPPPYPWGKEVGQEGVHFAPGGDNPRPVGSFPKGRSPYGCDDMVGNVAEWVVKDDGLWVLGGHLLLKAEEIFDSGGKSWLRDPAPGKAAFNALGSGQGAYTRYKVSVDDVGATGLRMVIVPGK